MTLRLTDEQERALELLADVDGVSKQQAATQAILDAAGRKVRERDVKALSAAARERYADVLDRLGR